MLGIFDKEERYPIVPRPIVVELIGPPKVCPLILDV
jgi:hypothetical protein